MEVIEIVTTDEGGDELVLWRGAARDFEHAVELFRASWRFESGSVVDPMGAVPDGHVSYIDRKEGR